VADTGGQPGRVGILKAVGSRSAFIISLHIFHSSYASSTSILHNLNNDGNELLDAPHQGYLVALMWQTRSTFRPFLLSTPGLRSDLAGVQWDQMCRPTSTTLYDHKPILTTTRISIAYTIDGEISARLTIYCAFL